jgi:hypothetical protein
MGFLTVVTDTKWRVRSVIKMRFVAFPATEYDEVLSGYQPGQMVERRENHRFKDHL